MVGIRGGCIVVASSHGVFTALHAVRGGGRGAHMLAFGMALGLGLRNESLGEYEKYFHEFFKAKFLIAFSRLK